MTAGEVTDLPVEDLTPHPLNSQIYADREDDEFVAQVTEHGVVEPVVVNGDRRIISGHRRWQAAREAGLETVPARVEQFDSFEAEREAILLHNDYRDKSPVEQYREAEQWEAIEKRRAQERMAEGGEGKSAHPSEKGRAAEKAADRFGISRRTYEKAKVVAHLALGFGEPVDPRLAMLRRAGIREWQGFEDGPKRSDPEDHIPAFDAAYERLADVAERWPWLSENDHWVGVSEVEPDDIDRQTAEQIGLPVETMIKGFIVAAAAGEATFIGDFEDAADGRGGQ